MRKYLFLPLIIFFIGCGSGSESGSVSSEPKEIRQDIENNINTEYAKWVKDGMPSAEVIPSPKKVEVLNDTTYSNFRTHGMLRSKPIKFSLNDINGDGNTQDTLLTSVKDQGQCGSCWVFAGVAALEGSYGESSSADFSEDQMKHTHGFYSQNACGGGNIWMIIGYMNSFRGLINESLDPYDDSPNSQYCSTCKPTKYVDNVILVPARRNTNDNETIKNILYNQKKPLYASVQVGWGSAGESGESSYEASTHSFLVTRPDAPANHAVVIVGWDDNYVAQGERGAFIVKNSWGASSGKNGYYYFPYADTTIGFGSLAYMEDTPENEFIFDKIHSHDEYGSVYSFSKNSGVEIANVFTATKDEDLIAASYVVEATGTNIVLEVHKVLSFNPLVTQKIADSITTQNNKMRGYHTTRFSNVVKIGANENFAVVVRYSSDTSSKVVVPVEGQANGFSPDAEASPAESFHRSVNGEWTDITSIRSDLNYPIKVMSIESVDEVNRATLEVQTDKNKVEVDEFISFSISFNQEGVEASSIRWDFGDNTSSTLISPNHSYASAGNYNVDVTVFDKDGHQYTKRVRVRVVEKDISTISDSNLSLYENAQAGDIIGDITTNFAGTVNIDLSGIGHENFFVNSNAEVVVAQNAEFDFETKSFYNLEATPIDGGGVDSAKDLNITILNVNEHEVSLADFSATINENSPTGTTVGSVQIISSGDSEITMMELSGADATSFDITVNGLITVSSTATLDFESKAIYEFNVNATNASGSSEDAQVVVNLGNVAETVPELRALTITIVENTAPLTTIASLGIISTGDTPISSITIEGIGQSDFTVSASGIIKIASGATIDFENQNEYNLSAVATNLMGPSQSVEVIINVSNAAEVLPEIDDFEITIFENTVENLFLGEVPIVTSGDTDLSFSLSGTGSSDFSISSDGNITVMNSLSFDRQSHYELTAVATNGAGTSSADVNIIVKDVPPQVTSKFKADDASQDALFSNALSLSNDMILVGAKGAQNGGAGYLFKQESRQNYRQLLKLTSNDILAGDAFGTSVSIDGSLMVLGAPKDDTNGTDAGAVYLYQYFSSDNSALQISKIIANDTTDGDGFGFSVHINGNLIFVGAPEHNLSGATYLFRYYDNNNTVVQKEKFTPALASDGDGFGSDIIMDGSNIVVGTKYGEAAYLYEYQSNDSVVEAHTFNSSDGITNGDFFGSRVSADGSSILCGSPGNDSAYLFKYSAGSVLSKKIMVAASGTGIQFGSDVAIGNEAIVIGAKNTDSIYIYDYNVVTFNINEPATHFVVNPAGVGSEVGSELEIKGEYLAIGASKESLESDNSGALFVANLDVENRPFLINYEPEIQVNENSQTVFTSLYGSVNGVSMNFSVDGVDKDIFSIDSSGVLSAQSLDYENPTDIGSNNIYSISIILTDSAGISFAYPMEIEVLNISD
ncbi:MAG: C1 family peptidase [Campylobacterota bacterium]|nr:C1 family peptidase [Campylobacterota bacterium]